ncbi:FUT3 isoform 5, partial [Pan troglodytes]
MDPLGAAKPQWPWRRCLAALLFQLLVAVCFFSYLRVSRDDATGSPRPGLMAVEPVTGAPSGSSRQDTTPTRPTLLILLWTWPFHIPVALSRCSEMVPGAADCHITADRKVYPQADAVI